MIRSFKRKIKSVNAIQFIDDAQCLCDISDWVKGIRVDYSDMKNIKFHIDSSGVIVNLGDYIVQAENGEFYPLSESEFLNKYDEVK